MTRQFKIRWAFDSCDPHTAKAQATRMKQLYKLLREDGFENVGIDDQEREVWIPTGTKAKRKARPKVRKAPWLR